MDWLACVVPAGPAAPEYHTPAHGIAIDGIHRKVVMMNLQAAMYVLCFWWMLFYASVVFGQPHTWKELAEPEVDGMWVRPAVNCPSQPVWGHAHGLRIGLAPMPGPRGLIRIYAPYLGHPPGRMINFIAVEPIVAGEEGRSFSELERSSLDHVRGKRFWSANDLDDLSPRPPEQPARGVLSRHGHVETMELFILIERFQSGAHPYLKIRFQSDRPHEVALAAFAHGDSKHMQSCILTATMGNYARLRCLQLAGRVVLANDLWPQFDGYGFAPAREFTLDQLARTPEGHAVVTATTNETEPENAQYAIGTVSGWKYQGKRAIQSWRCDNPPENLRVCVNGRTHYWASRRPIPGGISFENFEMITDFQDHALFWFGVYPQKENGDNPTIQKLN